MSDRTGQKLGNYYIQRSIGHGGFGDVYLGQHVYLNTYAAIKVLQAQLGQTEMQPFLAEARTIAGLSHPNIVRVLEFGVESQTPFLVMDYSPNGTLRQRHPKGSRITLHESVRYLTQVAGALQYAHDNKVIHRDIKPENMLVGQTGQILLSDFGIAIVSQSSRYQGQQHVGGTIAYMAPEQLQGKATYTSDQYSLGIVFYEWLTGEVPYKGSFAEIGSQHLFTPPPALRGNVPNITPAVEQVLQKALAKDPQQRFGRVQDFVQALEMASQGNDPTYVIQKSVVVPDQAQVPTFVPPVPNSNVSASGMSTLQQNMPPPPPSLAGAAYPQSMPTPTPLAGTSFQQNTPVLSSQSENYPPYPQNIPTPPPPPNSPFQPPVILTPPLIASMPTQNTPSPATPNTFSQNFTPQPGQFPQPPVARPKSYHKFYLIVITVLIVAVVAAGALAFYHPNGSSNPGTTTIAGTQTSTQGNTQTTPQSNTQTNPTSVPTPTPKVIPENLNIACINCQGGNYALTLKLSTITIDYSNRQTVMKYTLTNIGTVGCTVIFNKLEFQDESGTIFKAQNVGQSIVDIAVGNPFIASSTFDLLPRPNTHYLLSTSIDCTNRIDFKTQDFVFN